MRIHILLPILLMLFFSFGCISFFGEYIQNETAKDSIENIVAEPLDDVSCTCFLCKYGEEVIWPFSIFYEKSLENGYCSLLYNCETTDADGNLTISNQFDQEDYILMPFMLGMGTRSWDFVYANPFCNNGLNFMIHWLVSDGNEYTLPEASEAECFLSGNRIPVYALYSESKAIDSSSARELAEKMNGVGPVILISEIDFNSSVNGNYQKVKNQITAMRNACPRPDDYVQGTLHPSDEPYCMIALSVRLNDYEALDTLLSNDDILEDIDLVAIGVNSRYLKGDDCTSVNLYMEAINMSEHAWFDYGKPVIWPYMLFEVDSHNLNKTCYWSQLEVNNAYYQFFGPTDNDLSSTFIAAASSGVIGAAAYQFYSAGYPSDPLNCPSCGMITIKDGELAPKEGVFDSWFYGCQKVAQKTKAVYLSFPNSDGATCNLGVQLGSQFSLGSTTSAPASTSELYEADKTPLPDITPCLSCIAECEGENCNPNPYNIPTLGLDEYACTAVEEIDLWSSIRGLDSNYVRAYIWKESYFDPCAINDGDPSGEGCDEPSANKLVDIQGICTDEILAKSDRGVCALGIMQSKVSWGGYPYIYWDEENALSEGYDKSSLYITKYVSEIGAYPTIYKEGKINREAMEACAPEGKFNPFNASHALCYGTWKMRSSWDIAEGWVSTHEAGLGIENDLTKKENIIAFLAAYNFGGGYSLTVFNKWYDAFDDRWDDTGCSYDVSGSTCCSGTKVVDNVCCNLNDKNFIKFVSCCMDYYVDGRSTGPSRDSIKSYCNDVPGEFRKALDLEEDGVDDGVTNMLGLYRMVHYYTLTEGCESNLCGNNGQLFNNLETFYEDYYDEYFDAF